MKHIIKQNSPKAFEDWKVRKKVTKIELGRKKDLQRNQYDIWKTFQKKKDVRNAVKQALLDEQGHICCYCQNTIETTIEHFVPRSIDATRMFDYDNLFVCCKGGEEERQNQTYPSFCGSAKDNKELGVSPLEIDCQTHFDYFVIEKEDKIQIGVKGITNEGVDAIKILNLDNDELRKKRGEVLSPYLDEMLTREEVIKIHDSFLQQIANKPNNIFPAFCVVVVNILGKLI
jgi:uncharacterized protein (TIGR02646 family)